AYPLDESELPLVLPNMEDIKPGKDGEGPLSNLKDWVEVAGKDLTPNPSPLNPSPSPRVEKDGSVHQDSKNQAAEPKGAANVPKYSVYSPTQYEFAKQNRKGYTEAEKILWDQLRDSKLGVKFRRQHPIDAYITDFISLQNRLVIEVDGGYHETEEQKKYDADRTNVLEKIGFTVIRFSNEEILENVFAVTKKIRQILSNLKSFPNKESLPESIPLSTRGEGQGVRETSTMPGYAGSSWYFLRYMDPHNDEEFCSRQASDYWGQVDLYIGGTEHAVGHLLYSRMWTKFLYDMGLIGHDEPYKHLVNQGMIQGSSRFAYRISISSFGTISEVQDVDVSALYKRQVFISKNLYDTFRDNSTQELIKEFLSGEYKNFTATVDDLEPPTPIHVDVNIVDGVELDMDAFRKWKSEYKDAIFICEDGSINEPLSLAEGQGARSNQKYICGVEVEKMSKSKFNTVNPDDLVEKYGADTFRMYEMFLGPVEQSKPWDTKGIEGVHRFLRKLWRLFFDDQKGKIWTEAPANETELKTLHKAIKKIEEDTERFSFNTGVSAFMVCVNELTDLKCSKKEILEPLLTLLAPYAPHICEELWHALGRSDTILDAAYPKLEEKYLVESVKEYPISVNGKLRTTMNISLDASQKEVENLVLENGVVQKWLQGNSPKKIIYVKGRMVNVVL
ncbi:MAG TPA: DUF559 domain-containing protein, partial [Parafilimonas sp.]|nr:DUF559 domain-containing protein [Parafilimonas sp.]